MRTKIAKIGNELGLVLPKDVLEACGFGTEANVTVQNGMLIVSPSTRKAREGWAEAIDAIPEGVLRKDFEELQAFRETSENWDSSDWKWPEIGPDEKI